MTALWCASYLGRSPLRMRTVSSTEGASTLTDWKRRSRAESFSMCLRYSLSVVAPMHWSSPRLRAGLMMLEASMAPSADPAPTMVWSSSMKRMMFLFLRISSMTALIRSSNWPRYFVPATIRARSRVMTRFSARSSGTLPETISCARPSAIAVFPTPASPMRTGLFLLRRQRIWMTRSISSARPMTGSSSPLRALSVRSRPKAFSAGVLASLRAGPLPAAASSPSCPSGISPSSSSDGVKFGSSSFRTSLRVRSRSTSRLRSTWAATPSPSRSNPSRMCSVPT